VFLSNNQQNSEKKMRLAIIGAGRIGLAVKQLLQDDLKYKFVIQELLPTQPVYLALIGLMLLILKC